MTAAPSETPKPRLIVTGGSLDGSALVIAAPGQQKLLGSGPECDLQLQAANVDARHARVVWDDSGLVLTDVESTAGTYVNGERIETAYPLQDGDRVCLGPPGSKQSVKLVAHVPAEALESPQPAAATEEEDILVLEEPAAPAPAPTDVPPDAGRAAVHETPATRGDDSAETIYAAPPVREPLPEPRRERPAAPAKAGGIRVPRVLWLVAATAVVVGGGLAVKFLRRAPVPALGAISPVRFEPLQSVALTGTGFDSDPGGNVVRFGTRVGEVTSASVDRLTVTAPAELAADAPRELPVTVETRGGRSNAVAVTVRRLPGSLELDPEVALPGGEVLLTGQGLDLKPLSVRVGGVPAEVVSASADSVRFVVPQMAVVEGRSVPVTVQVGGESAPVVQLLLGRLPLVTELVPSRGQAGDAILIRGRGFDADAARDAVTLGGEPALVLSATATELKAVVPQPPPGGGPVQVPVVVGARGASSSGNPPFTVDRPSSGMFVPRFFAAPLGEQASVDRVFVSTELGPVLVLSARDGTSSAAERALGVASALNSLFAGSRGGTVEVRPGPPPSVAVVGSPGVLVRVFPEDAAGYAPPVTELPRGLKLTPAALAAHWAAVLQDMLALFVQKQRPVRVLETSPRGKVLVDVYTEAERRTGAGGGVPTGVVQPLPYSIARGFRDLTLTPPTQSQATPGAAVAGLWQGVMEEAGVGERPIRLRLRLDGGRLAGSMTTHAGTLAMDIPLQEISYENGVLSFRVAGGSAPRRFRGNLSGSSLSGSILGPAGDAKPLGQFRLRYLE